MGLIISTMQRHISKPALKAIGLASIRFSLLSMQLGAVVGAIVFVLMSIGGGSYAGVIFGVGSAIAAAIGVFITLITRYLQNRKTNPQLVASQARKQWLWLSVCAFVLILFL